MDQGKLKKWIEELIKCSELWRFYKSNEWISLRDKVLADGHNECERCKSKGIVPA